MKNEIYEKNKNILADFFSSGCKEKSIRTIGLEIEHFIVYKDSKKAIPYDGDTGVAHIISELSAFYPDAKITSFSPLLGFTTHKFAITIEPACQFEISIYPCEEIAPIKKIYEEFRKNLNTIIEPLGLLCLTIGYQPKSCVDDLALIPKKRYEYMDQYFKTSGTMGKNMMKGTCATQISIDYFNEEDMRKKIQVIYALSPYFKLLTDNSPYFEGKENKNPLLRSTIWENVDNKRCGFIPGVMDKDFGFKKYADFILNLPPIFVPANIAGTDTYLGDATVIDYLEDKTISYEEIEHFISMPFPDVRIKKYLEIRVADSLPFDKLYAYCALIKGLAYNDDFMEKAYDFIITRNINIASILNVIDDIYKKGWDAMFYTMPIKEAHTYLLNQAGLGLPDHEALYLKGFENE